MVTPAPVVVAPPPAVPTPAPAILTTKELCLTQYQGFYCERELRCIESSKACDAINDCADGSDETVCSGWNTISSTSLFSPPSMNAITINLTFNRDACRRATVIRGGLGFAFRRSASTCIVYGDKNRIIAALNNPNRYLVSDSGDVDLVIRLTNPDLYRQCSAALHCSGKGTLLVANFDEALNACPCQCDAGWVGYRCNIPLALSDVNSYVAVVGLTSSARPWVRSQFHAALSFNRTDISFQSDVPEKFNATHLAIIFRVTGTAISVTSYQQRIFRSEEWPEISANLVRRLLPELAFVSGTTTPTQSREASCLATGSSVDVSCQGDQSVSSPTRRFRINTDSALAPFTIRYTFLPYAEESSFRRRQVVAQQAEITCDRSLLQTTLVSIGCERSVCSAALPDPGRVETIAIVPSNRTAVSDPTCDLPSVQQIKSAVLLNATVQTTPSVTDPRAGSILEYGIYVVIAAVVLLLGSLGGSWVMSGRVEREVDRIRHAAKVAEEGFWTAHILAREVYYQSHSASWVVGHLIVVLLLTLLACAGGFAWVLYSAEDPIDTDFDVVMEEYIDKECETSPYAFLPTVASSIRADGTCRRVSAAGGKSTQLFTKAKCPVDSPAIAEVRLADTFSSCSGSDYVAVPINQCIPKSRLFADNANSQFVRIRCLPQSTAQRLLASLSALSPLPIFNQTIATEFVSSTIPRPIVLESGGISRYAFLEGSTVVTSTSNYPSRVATMANAQSYIGSFNRYALVYHQSTSFSLDVDPARTNLIETVWGRNQTRLSSSPSLTPHLPEADDYPIGFVFNNYNTPNEIRGAFGFTSHRYPHMAGTQFDLGTLFNADTRTREGEGLTLSFWMRASPRSEGFVFAMTDFYQKTATFENPILTRLATVVNGGRDPLTTWFDSTYHVYYSVYVDGPSRLLRFIYADPLNEVANGTDPIVVAEWRLAAIDQLPLLNDQWHQVRFLITNLNFKVNIQLVVDGITNYADAGWTVCIGSRRFTPIQVLPADVLVQDRESDVVLQGGVLTVGYFNGGVHGIEVATKPIPRASLHAGCVSAFRNEANDFGQRFGTSDTDGYLILAYILCAFAILMLCGAAWGFRAYRKLVNAQHTTLREVNADAYRRVIWSRRFQKKTGYHELPFAVALEILNLDGKEFMIMMEDLNRTTSAVRENLVRLLWRGWLETKNQGMDRDDIISKIKYQAEEISRDVPNLIKDEERKSIPDDHEIIHNHRRYRGVCGAIERLPLPTVGEWNNMVFETQMTPGGEDQNRFKETEEAYRRAQSEENDFDGLKTGLQAKKAVRVATMPSYANLVEATLHVLQGVAVYAAVLQFPQAYRNSLGATFEFVSLDYSHAFNLPQTVTPIMQSIIAVIILVCFSYVALLDDRRFMTNLAKFVQMRDMADAATDEERAAIKQREVGLETMRSWPSEVRCLVYLFSPLDRLKIDRFIKNLNVRDELNPGLDLHETVALKAADGTRLTLYRSQSGNAAVLRTNENKTTPPAPMDEHSHPVETISVKCPCHDQLLVPLYQNDVRPFEDRRTCCAVDGGVPCNRTIGTLYVCNRRSRVESQKFVCDFALCERHWRPTYADAIRSYLHGLSRSIDSYGLVIVFTRFLVLTVTSLYMPFMRTAIMVIACHPFYRCSFGDCWETMEPIFAISAYVTMLTLVLFGVLLPIMCVIVLVRRYHFIKKAFRVGEPSSPYLGKDGEIDVLEWTRFLSSDDSAMSALYNQLLPSRMKFMPVFLLFKLILVLPVILIEPNTIEQMIGIAFVEVLYGIVTLAASPYISPWIDMYHRVGSAHQMAVLGFLCFYSIGEVEAEAFNPGASMLTISSAYLIFVASCFAIITAEPFVTQMLFERRREMILHHFGIAPAPLSRRFLAGFNGSAIVKSKAMMQELSAVSDEDRQAHNDQLAREHCGPPGAESGIFSAESSDEEDAFFKLGMVPGFGTAAGLWNAAGKKKKMITQTASAATQQMFQKVEHVADNVEHRAHKVVDEVKKVGGQAKAMVAEKVSAVGGMFGGLKNKMRNLAGGGDELADDGQGADDDKLSLESVGSFDGDNHAVVQTQHRQE